MRLIHIWKNLYLQFTNNDTYKIYQWIVNNQLEKSPQLIFIYKKMRKFPFTYCRISEKCKGQHNLIEDVNQNNLFTHARNKSFSIYLGMKFNFYLVT